MLGLREIVHTIVWTGRHLLGRMPVEAVELLRPHVGASDVLVDVGAHSGNWTVALSRLVPDGQVYAFEALPYYARVLGATLRILRRTNVEVIDRPLLDEARPVELVYADAAGRRLTGYTHLRGPGERSTGTVAVEGTTLDDMFAASEPRLRFIKLDIEGAELLALRGALRLLETSRPLLYLEIDETYCARYGHSAADVFDFLTSQKYRGYVRADASWMQMDASNYEGNGDVWFVPIEDVAEFLGGSSG